MKRILTFFLGLLVAASMYAQPLYVNPAQFTPFQLIDSVLVTGCLQAMNVSYTGDPIAKGYFQRSPMANNWAFANGVLLTSGSVMVTPGPNNSGSAGLSNSGVGDPQLQTLISSTINDAAVLQFDFVPHSNLLEFYYIFGSEEYPEFVGTSFNDVFGFFLTGPGCPGSASYINTNIATIPGTTIPVAINNINQNVNTAYYVTNGTTPTVAVQYDGFTVPLPADACVVPCQTYHIKLAIGDAGDSAYDSGVFLQGGSLSSGDVVAMTNYNQSGQAINQVVEGCSAYYVFHRTDTTDMTQPLSVMLNISGTASTASDISGFPVTFTIPIGQSSDTIFYNVILDNVVEGTEYLVFHLLNGCPCTPGNTTDTIWIIDNVLIDGGIVQNDTLICAGQGVNSVNITLQAAVNTAPNITSYHWSTGSTNPTITVNVPAGQITTYSVTVSDICGQVITDDIDITISNLNTYTFTATNLQCNAICQGSAVITPLDGFAPYTYSWTPGGVGMTTTGVANNLCAGNYSVTITDAFGCKVNKAFAITQPPVTVLSFTSDSASCPGASDGVLNATVNYGPGNNYPVVPSYVWSCSGFIPVNDNDNQYSFQNLPAGNYTVNVIDGHGCTTSGIYSVGEKEMHFTPNITHVKCYGGSDGVGSFSIQGGTGPYIYSWNTGETVNHINQKPAGNYSCTVTDHSGCQIIVPITINQPPRLEFSNSLDTIMCKGQATQLSASAQGGTPSYHYVWTVNGNQIGTGDLLAYSPSQTTTVTLTVSDNNGCVQPSHYVVVQIYPKVVVNLYTNDAVVCSGESTIIYADVSGGNGGPYTITDPDENIILPPFTVIPTADLTFSVYANDECGSPQGTDVQVIQVEDPPAINFYAVDSIGCSPFSTQFIETSADHGQSYLWQFGIDNNAISLSKNPAYTFEAFGSYDISLTVTSAAGCSKTVEAFGMITVLPTPVVSVMPDPPVTSSLNPVIYFMNGSDSPLDTATIFFGDGSSQGLPSEYFQEVQHTYLDTGVFEVYLVGVNLDGCLDTAYTDVEVYAEHKQIFAPNVINPMSVNSENQLFLPTGFAVDKENYHLMIYNRWGEMIFESLNGNIGWTGRTPDGKIVKSDTYQWVLIYKDSIGKTLRESGNVTVLY